MAFDQFKEVWNTKTGQWERNHERRFSKKSTPDSFTMLMHPLHPLLLKIKHVKDLHVLFGLCEMAEFNTNKVFLIASRRQELMNLVSMTSQHLSNSLTRLRADGIIYGGKGEAIINPAVFWKGSSVERAAALKAMPGLTIKDVKSDFENEKG